MGFGSIRGGGERKQDVKRGEGKLKIWEGNIWTKDESMHEGSKPNLCGVCHKHFLNDIVGQN